MYYPNVTVISIRNLLLITVCLKTCNHYYAICTDACTFDVCILINWLIDWYLHRRFTQLQKTTKTIDVLILSGRLSTVIGNGCRQTCVAGCTRRSRTVWHWWCVLQRRWCSSDSVATWTPVTPASRLSESPPVRWLARRYHSAHLTLSSPLSSKHTQQCPSN